jgi:hypothetical protein
MNALAIIMARPAARDRLSKPSQRCLGPAGFDPSRKTVSQRFARGSLALKK